MASARSATAVERVWKAAGGVFHAVDDATQGRMLAARQQALTRVAASPRKPHLAAVPAT